MANLRNRLALVALCAAVLVPAGLLPVSTPALAQPADLPIPPATTDRYPPGVRVAQTAKGPVYVDSAGRVLYGMDMRVLMRAGPDPSQYCTAACAQTWQPLLAPAGSEPNIAFPRGFGEPARPRPAAGAAAGAGNVAAAGGSQAAAAAEPVFYANPQKAPDWTVIAGPQGPQWVYKGWHMVFVRRGDRPGSTAYDGADNMAWNTLKFVPPVPDVVAPQGVRPLLAGGAYALADKDGRILFTGACAKDCGKWRPLTGGMATAPMGAWRVSNAEDAPQWTYHGKPVFVSQEDDPRQVPEGALNIAPVTPDRDERMGRDEMIDDELPGPAADSSARRWIRPAALAAIATGLLAIGPTATVPLPLEGAAVSEPIARPLPAPPANGIMGFVVETFTPPVIQGKDACPNGTQPRLKDAYLKTLPEAEQARLRQKQYEKEFTDRWHAYAFGKNGTNVCSQPDMFDHAPFTPVESRFGWGLNLDGGKGTESAAADGCHHEKFVTPTGMPVDNQEYRALGCSLEWRGTDGIKGDIAVGMRQFHNSGEWTQVILLKGVDSLVNDPDVEVEVIYANTPDRPLMDSKGNYLPGMSFNVSTTLPRHRNVLHGRIVNGVLTTDPADVKLTETWGQGGARDIRGNRGTFHYERGRLRLEFQPDGSLHGFLGGYRPLFDVLLSTALGGAGSAIVAGIDCSAELASLRKYADGMRDPKTGQCTAISGAEEIKAVPAFVTDVPGAAQAPAGHRIASRKIAAR